MKTYFDSIKYIWHKYQTSVRIYNTNLQKSTFLLISIFLINSLSFHAKSQLRYDYIKLSKKVGIDSAIVLFIEREYVTMNNGFNSEEKIKKIESMIATTDFFESELLSMKFKNKPDSFMVKNYGFYAMTLLNNTLLELTKIRCHIISYYTKLLNLNNYSLSKLDFNLIENQCENTEFIGEILFSFAYFCKKINNKLKSCSYFNKSCKLGYQESCKLEETFCK
jgi:hypothetical protein